MGYCNNVEAPACHHSEWLDITDCTCKPLPTSCPTGFAWTGSECICLDQGCGEYHHWEYHECRCVCDEVGPDCNADVAALDALYGYTFNASRTYFWDTCSCSCVAAPIDCPADTAEIHYAYSSTTGECLCIPQAGGCADGEYFDTSTCECRCSPR